MDSALRTRNVLIVCLSLVIVTLALFGMCAAISITGTKADRDAFSACVASGHSPSECNLAIFGRTR